MATAIFIDAALQAGTALSQDGNEQGSMGVAIGDYDHSGGWSITTALHSQNAAPGRLRAGAHKVDFTPNERELAVSTDSIRDPVRPRHRGG
jgi:hypothetical protein